MKNVINKIKLITLNMAIVIMMYSSKVFAGIDLDVNDFKPDPNGAKDASKLASKAGIVLGIIQAIGTVVSVVVLIIIGIKYMLGSVEEKADYKQTMKPYVIGCALLFIIPNLVQIIFQFAISMNT